jgi:hypothetical protein
VIEGARGSNSSERETELRGPQDRDQHVGAGERPLERLDHLGCLGGPGSSDHRDEGRLRRARLWGFCGVVALQENTHARRHSTASTRTRRNHTLGFGGVWWNSPDASRRGGREGRNRATAGASRRDACATIGAFSTSSRRARSSVTGASTRPRPRGSAKLMPPDADDTVPIAPEALLGAFLTRD